MAGRNSYDGFSGENADPGLREYRRWGCAYPVWDVGRRCRDILQSASFAAKLSVGMMIGSISVMADGFNNLSDSASSLVGFVGMKMAGKPADEDHPFGHGRIEYISAFVVASW